MNKIDFCLTISQDEQIFFQSFDLVFNLLPLYDCQVFYKKNGKIFLIADDTIQSLLEEISVLLIKVLHNKLPINTNQNIGMLWNEESHLLVNGQDQRLVDLGFLLWSTPGDIKPSLSTWLYNDKEGNIFLEVTPNYYWHFVDPLPDEKDYITYEQFMKSYKSLITTLISDETALKWLEQIQELLKVIRANEDMMLNK